VHKDDCGACKVSSVGYAACLKVLV
jgi:hypothetical protein